MVTRLALAFVSFLAGAVCAVTLMSLGFASQPTPMPCSPEVERAYEIMRFASYSHTSWLDWFKATGESVDSDGDGAEWHQWWADHYAEVMAAVEGMCIPDEQYPPLDSLPGEWKGYPERGSRE